MIGDAGSVNIQGESQRNWIFMQMDNFWQQSNAVVNKGGIGVYPVTAGRQKANCAWYKCNPLAFMFESRWQGLKWLSKNY
jgi:hypothetical protein